MKKNSKYMCYVDAQDAQIRFSRDEGDLSYMATIHIMWSVWLKAGAWTAVCRGGGSAA